MATDVQIALQSQAGVDPAAAQVAAAVRQVRASLALLSQQVGQSFVGTVVEAPELPSGFSQIATTPAHTILRLERPIPPGSRVQISVQPGPSPTAPPVITVTPLASERLVPSAPNPVQTPPPQLVQLQQSPGPLIESLGRQLAHLPPAVAQAASQLLAQRLPLDRAPPTAVALKAAVLQSGIFLDAPARAAGPPDIRTALIQLRSALLNWTGGGIDPVAPASRRPPPPMRGAQPRAPLLPTPPIPDDGSPPQETARHLLAQTEGALARLKLMQLTSERNDQRLGTATAPAEWNLELPLLVGRELAMAQIQIGREAREQKSGREQSWRLRFALRLSAIGEVGAHIALTGRRTSVALWAENPETAAVLEDMLPDLSHALAAKGLEVGTLTIKRGAPQPAAAAPGHLMDAMT